MQAYYESLKQWIGSFVKEPHSVVFASVLYLIFALTIISSGVAVMISLSYIRCCAEGKVFKLKEYLPSIMKTYSLKATILWLANMMVIFFWLGAVLLVIFSNIGAFMRIVLIIFAIANAAYISSTIYQFPMLLYNEELKPMEVITKSIAMSLDNFSITVMILCVMVLLLIVSILTGVGLVFLLPGGMMLLMVYTYKNVVNKYIS